MSPVAALVACATAPDLSRKRQADQADRKAPKNRARYLLNLVAEAAERLDGCYTDADLLEAALLVARARA